MHILTCVCLVLALISLASMVYFILRHVVRPILVITDATLPLQKGDLRASVSRAVPRSTTWSKRPTRVLRFWRMVC